jgi:hypothetical protein
MPFKDHWLFWISDYFPYLNGQYRTPSLFALFGHSEHRVFTTRLVLFADGIVFQMGGFFPIVVMYIWRLWQTPSCCPFWH